MKDINLKEFIKIMVPSKMTEGKEYFLEELEKAFRENKTPSKVISRNSFEYIIMKRAKLRDSRSKVGGKGFRSVSIYDKPEKQTGLRVSDIIIDDCVV